jgi:hypothetical protein
VSMNSSQNGGLASNDPDTGLNSRIGLFLVKEKTIQDLK